MWRIRRYTCSGQKQNKRAFINAQFDKAYRVIRRLAKTKEGQRKIVGVYGIKNVKGYPKLLKDLQ